MHSAGPGRRCRHTAGSRCHASQVTQLLAVMFISRSDAGTVDQPCGAVHANVRFHAKVPLSGFESLVHLWITRFVLIFGGTRCENNGGIHDGAAAQLQAVSLQQLADSGKDGCAQVVFLQQVAKVQQGGRVGYALAAQVNFAEVSKSCDVIQRVLTGFVCQIEPAGNQYMRSMVASDRGGLPLPALG